ncbi:MAG: hypothetical protein DRI61_10365 [Chloroflexi bacterium]|nr:MAG: hypothetical protein DRI61_10365 [Chloroflexota bacterium]
MVVFFTEHELQCEPHQHWKATLSTCLVWIISILGMICLISITFYGKKDYARIGQKFVQLKTRWVAKIHGLGAWCRESVCDLKVSFTRKSWEPMKKKRGRRKKKRGRRKHRLGFGVNLVVWLGFIATYMISTVLFIVVANLGPTHDDRRATLLNMIMFTAALCVWTLSLCLVALNPDMHYALKGLGVLRMVCIRRWRALWDHEGVKKKET